MGKRLLLLALIILLTGSTIKLIPAQESIFRSFAIPGHKIRISIENYQRKSGWTPLVLFLGELEISLWMSPNGLVTDNKDCPPANRNILFIINMDNLTLESNSNKVPILIDHQYQLRTRISLYDKSEFVSLRIEKFGKRVTLIIGTACLRFSHLRVQYKIIQDNVYEITFKNFPVIGYPKIFLNEIPGQKLPQPKNLLGD